MRLIIHTVHCALPEADHQALRRRAAYALGRFSTRVGALSLRISDVNGPRGGIGFTCLARVRLRGSAAEIIANAASDRALQSALLAMERARSGVAHAVDRALAMQGRG